MSCKRRQPACEVLDQAVRMGGRVGKAIVYGFTSESAREFVAWYKDREVNTSLPQHVGSTFAVTLHFSKSGGSCPP
jgi:hypothetical protein